jgi:hypothetical protein
VDSSQHSSGVKVFKPDMISIGSSFGLYIKKLRK